ncbi:hypothetical protein D3C87_1685400 [compost metagenome]
MPVQPLEALAIFFKVPCGHRIGQKRIRIRQIFWAREASLIRLRGGKDAKAKERHVARFRRERRKLRFEQEAGLVGHVAGKVFPGAAQPLHALQGGKKRFRLVRDDDLFRLGEGSHRAGRIIPEKNVRRMCQ